MFTDILKLELVNSGKFDLQFYSNLNEIRDDIYVLHYDTFENSMTKKIK